MAGPSKNPVLIPLTDEEHRDALELFATETPEIPQPQRTEAPVVDVWDVPFEHEPFPPEQRVRRDLTWQAPLMAAAITAVATIGVLMSLRIMHTSNDGELATLRSRPVESANSLGESLVTTAATSLTSGTIPSNDELATVLGSTEVGHENSVAKALQSLQERDRAPLPAPAASPPALPLRSEETPSRREPPVQSAQPSTVQVAEPVQIPEPRVAPPLGSPTLPAGVPVEPSPVVARSAGTPREEAGGTALPRMPPSEAGAIQTVLSQYRTAFRDLDAGAARAIWPSVDTKALSKAFESLERQDLIFNSCQIAVRDVRAVASCDGTARYVPRIGNRDRHDDRRTWEFKLSKVDEVWLIDTVSAR
jgi:hypothetical protein